MKLNLAILSARRTPVGTFLGSLKSMSPTEMGVISAKAALEDSGLRSEDFVHSVYGNVCAFSSPDGVYLARHIALKAGLPISVGSLTVNRLCGSGFEALVQSDRWVSEGACLVGGAESMSLAPLILRGVREGFKFAKPPVSVDSLWESLSDLYAGMAMGETAELLAKENNISREDCDRWALLSHQRATQAEASGATAKEIVSFEHAGKMVTHDEHIRRDTSLEKLVKLKPAFGGVTTAGNASGMNDAAASLVVVSGSSRPAKSPLARVIGATAVGCDPKRMGIGPVAAIEKLLKEVGWKISEVDYVEVNEAFAAQVLAVKKQLKLSDEQLNPHGSGISLGHPLGATGARISCHIAHLIASGRSTKAIGSACIGGGQGIAVAFEKF